jgi:Mn-dependent DtxR family transcriptional regulator
MFAFLVAVLLGQSLKKQFRKMWTEKDIQNQNALKNIYQYLERSEFRIENISLNEYAAFRNITLKESAKQLGRLCREDYLSPVPGESVYFMSPKGWREAFRIIRAHRLWEMYLLKTKGVNKDDVHLEAEFKEHLLSAEEISQVEMQLNFPTVDPHGKIIPGVWQRKSRDERT